MDIEIDYAPLKGMNFTCLEGCGFCCSFPAEVREWEKHFPAILEKNADPFRKWDEGKSCLCGIFTMKQQNERGGCIFLREDMRCGIYDVRSLLCRIFPIKIFFGWRVQLYPSMSCRGFSEDDNADMVWMGKDALSELPQILFEKMLEESRTMYLSLPQRLKDYIAPEVLQNMLLEYVDLMTFDPWNISDTSIDEFEKELSSEDFLNLPTYLTEDLQWQVFKLEDGFARRSVLKETGETEVIDKIVYYGLSGKSFSSKAADAIHRYLRSVASTDHFIGIVYRKAIEQDTGGLQLAELAIAELEKFKEIFILKASLLAEFEKRERVDEKTVKDTIVLCDGYLATMPAFGMIL